MDTVDRILGWPLFSVGDTTTTLGSFLMGIILIIATLLLARITRKMVEGFVQRLHEQEAKEARAYGIVTQLIIWVIGFELALHVIGIRLTTLFATAGFFAIAAGFAAKNIVENFLSGSILRLERIIQPGDLIVVNGRPLIAQRVGMRIMKAQSFDGEDILIPNSLLAQSMVENLTRDDRLHRIQIRVGVAYESDLALVRETLEQAIDQLEWRSTAKNPEVYLREFGDSSVNYDVDVWIDEANDSRARLSDLHESVWRALKEKGITIAFPQLDLHLDQNVVDAVARQNWRPGST